MKVDHFHFLCRDPEAAADFFVRQFDGELYETVRMPDWRILRVRVGGTVLVFSPERGAPLAEPAARPARGFDHIAITVEDVDAVVDRLRGDDVEVLNEPFDISPTTRVAYVVVPDAIQLELLQPIGG